MAGWNPKFAFSILTFLAVSWAMMRVNHALFYETVQAKVKSVDSECYFEDSTYMVVVKRIDSSKTHWPCTDIKAVQAEIPEFADWNIRGYGTLAFEYISPADQKTRSGTLNFNYVDNPEYATKRKGDLIAILAHHSDPKTYAKVD